MRSKIFFVRQGSDVAHGHLIIQYNVDVSRCPPPPLGDLPLVFFRTFYLHTRQNDSGLYSNSSLQNRHTKSMLSALNFIETRCTLNANVKHTMHLHTSLIWSAWVHHLTMKIYKFWYWFFFFIKLPKWSVLAVSGENQLLCWRGMHIRRRIRIKWMQIARLSICYQHLRRYGGLWLIEWLLQLFPLRIFLLQEG